MGGMGGMGMMNPMMVCPVSRMNHVLKRGRVVWAEWG